MGNLKKITDPLARVTDNDYDGLNRLIKTWDAQTPVRGETEYGYDLQDNLVSVKDPKGNTTTYTYNGLGDRTQQVSPDTGTTTYTHDPAGNVQTSTDARAVTANYSYDELNRVTQVVYSKAGSPSETHSYTYDTCTNGLSRLCSLTDTSGSTSYAYDIKGRLVSKSQTVAAVGAVPARSFTIGYGYNAAGQLNTITLPSGEVVGYSYNSNNQISSVTTTPPGGSAVTLLSNAGYDPFGPVSGWTWGNGSKAFFDYDTDGRLILTETQLPDTTPILKKQVGWDKASRVLGLTDLITASLTRSYGYDAVDQLNAVTAGSDSQGFTYDKNGNRLTQTATTGGTTVNTSYTVPTTSNRLNSVTITGGSTTGYTYDAVGNPTQVGTNTFTYNLANRLVEVNAGSTAVYRLNALGQRVLKVTTSGATYFAYDEQGRLVGEYSQGTTMAERVREQVWLSYRPVGVLSNGGATGTQAYYVHADHLGTPRAITRPSDNALVWKWDSVEPFGNNPANENPTGLGTFQMNLRHPGQYYDHEVGTFYNYFRDYDPATGKYRQSDPIGLKGGRNTYSYTKSEPLRFVDPWGLSYSVWCAIDPRNMDCYNDDRPPAPQPEWLPGNNPGRLSCLERCSALTGLACMACTPIPNLTVKASCWAACRLSTFIGCEKICKNCP